jgi:hypothetical protein
MSEQKPWQAGTFPGPVLALAIPPDSGLGIVVSDGHAECCVNWESLGEFLDQHLHSEFVCLDAITMHETLVMISAPLGRADHVWELLRAGRLWDVRVLRDLVISVMPGTPAEGALADLSPEPGKLLDRYRRIREQVDDTLAKLKVPLDLVQRFGPLGHHLVLQAGIAVSLIGKRGARLAPGARDRVLDCCRRRRDELIALLMREWKSRQIFRFRDNKPSFDAAGRFPKFSDTKVRSWLNSEAGRLHDVHATPLPFPMDKQSDEHSVTRGHASIRPMRWAGLNSGHPLIEGWIELHAVCHLWAEIEGNPSEELHPSYSVFDLMGSNNPNLEIIHRMDTSGPIYAPRDGKKLLVLELRDLNIRALACTLERCCGPSSLFQALQSGRDAVADLASRLPDQQDGAARERIARLLLRHIPVGHSDDLLHKQLGANGLQYPLADVLRFRQIMLTLWPELVVYLEAPAVQFVADWHGSTKEELRAKWMEYTGEDLDSGKFARALFDPFPGEYTRGEVRGFILGHAGVSLAEYFWVARLTEADFGIFFSHGRFVTPSGRVRGRATCWEVLGKRHLYLADAVRKRALFELVRQGTVVCACFGDAFLIEVNRLLSVLEVQVQVDTILRAVVEEMLGSLPGTFRVQLADDIPPTTGEHQFLG